MMLDSIAHEGEQGGVFGFHYRSLSKMKRLSIK